LKIYASKVKKVWGGGGLRGLLLLFIKENLLCWRHGSSDRTPASRAQSPEFNPSTTTKKKKETMLFVQAHFKAVLLQRRG
jgi:hypothetical protein